MTDMMERAMRLATASLDKVPKHTLVKQHKRTPNQEFCLGERLEPRASDKVGSGKVFDAERYYIEPLTVFGELTVIGAAFQKEVSRGYGNITRSFIPVRCSCSHEFEIWHYSLVRGTKDKCNDCARKAGIAKRIERQKAKAQQ